MTETTLLAVDGGGTKTEFVLLAPDGRVLRRVRLGASNPFDIGFDGTEALLREGFAAILRGSAPAAAFAGLSGGGSGSSSEKLKAVLERILPGVPAAAGSDMINAIASGSLSGDGCAVIAGTGSSAFARKDGAVTRCGGWGNFFDGAGSGYDLGAGAIAHTLRVHDGRDAPSLLSELTVKALGGSPADLLTDIYAGGKRKVASVAPAVFEACDAGDERARALIERTADYLAEIVSTVCRRAGLTQTPVVCIGGLWNRRDLLLPRFTAGLTPGLSPVFPDAPPVFGAAAEAARLAGVPVTPAFRERFLQTWED